MIVSFEKESPVETPEDVNPALAYGIPVTCVTTEPPLEEELFKAKTIWFTESITKDWPLPELEEREIGLRAVENAPSAVKGYGVTERLDDEYWGTKKRCSLKSADWL